MKEQVCTLTKVTKKEQENVGHKREGRKFQISVTLGREVVQRANGKLVLERD